MPENQDGRLAALARYTVLDTDPEPIFDNITQLAAVLCGTQMSALTLIDHKRQWIKSTHGLRVTETACDISLFGSYTILGNDVFEVSDTKADPRFANNPVVLSSPHIRFYAGVPLVTTDGFAIGSLAVLDRDPRKLEPHRADALKLLARQAMTQLELLRERTESCGQVGLLVQASPLPTMVVDLEGRVTQWNPAAEQLFGWTAQEVLGRVNPIVPRGTGGLHGAVLHDVLHGKIITSVESTRKHKNGSAVDVSISASPIKSNNGRIIGAFVLYQDIRETKRTTRQLEESLSVLRATLESTTDGILVVDRAGIIQAFNKKFLDIWKMPAPAIGSGMNAEALRSAMDQISEPQPFAARVKELHKAPERESFDVVELKDGRVLERYSAPQRRGEEIVGRVWSFRDVTGRVHLEAQLRQSQKMEAVGSLAGGIAHDFNNLLSIIIGHTALLQSELPPTSESLRRVEEVRDAADRASTLVRQLLTFSRKQSAHSEVLELNTVVRNIFNLIKRLLGEDIELSLQLAHVALPIKADHAKIEQILMNLVVNARDAMTHGGRLIITTDVHVANVPFSDASNIRGDSAELRVADTGPGIDATVLPRIFEPFFTTKEVGKGTGLGLSTVYAIVRQLGGDISVTSQLGEGTEFRVLLPIVSELAGVPQPKDITDVSSSSGHETILVVEDEPELRILVGEVLRQQGYRVLEAKSPQDALRIARAYDDEIHLLLTDVVMPIMRGGELALHIREQRPSIRLLFMSGYAEQDSDHIYRSGSLIEKPFPPQALTAKVRQILDRTEVNDNEDEAQ
ncbi:MAG TPA: PAS domain S-box protein [Clostridia bacterium]|nr:PAS domain S-box protein [Clostridia bacterium]